MSGKHHDDMDIVKELRLRRWAREHHVPMRERRPNWHPVVLDEMRRKDDEQLIRSRSRPPVSSFVPLVPTTIQRVVPHTPEPPRKQVSAVDRLPATQRPDKPHDSFVSHVTAAVAPRSSIGTLQVTIVGD